MKPAYHVYKKEIMF